MSSICCLAPIITEHRPELYHGSDDGYELVIPFLVCSECGDIQLNTVDTKNDKRLQSVGGI